MSKKLYICIALALTLLGCSNNDNFTAGPEATNSKGYVYFGSDYDDVTIYGEQPSKNDTIWITVVRDSNKCSTALTVPIESEADNCLNIPKTAYFEAGKDTAYLAITCNNLVYTKESNYTLTIPTEYADPYRKKDGITSLKSGVLWSAWTDVADTVLITSSLEVFPDQGCKLQNLSGMNRFRFTDFMGSGNPLEFSIVTEKGFNSQDLTDNAGKISPLKNYYNETYCWDWANDGNYSPWTPKNGTFEISYISFYPSYYGNYDWLDLTVKNKINYKINGVNYYYDYEAYSKSRELVYIYDSAKTNSAWDYIYFMILYRDKSN